MELDKAIVDWLLIHHAITPNEIQGNLHGEKITLQQSTTQKLQNGYKFAGLLQSIIQKDPTNDIKLKHLNQVQDQYDPSSVLSNWKIVVGNISQFGLDIDSHTFQLLTQGNHDSIEAILLNLRKIETGLSNEENTHAVLSIDINSIDVTKALSDTVNSLEMLIISLSRVFEFDSKQSAGHFTENSKHLARLVLKGVRGDFTQVMEWYKLLVEDAATLLGHLAKESTEQRMQIYAILRYGFYCKNADTAQWCIRLYNKLSLGAANLPSNDLYSWFITKDGGIDALLYLMAKHPQFEGHALLLLFNVASSNVESILFNVIASKYKVQKSYLEFLYNVVVVVINTAPLKEKAASESLLLAIAKRLVNSSFNDWDAMFLRIKILVDIWCTLMDELESIPELPNTILSTIRKMCKDRRVSIAYIGYSMLFKLFECFSEFLKPYAPVIYKTITMLAIEESGRKDIKIFILQNLFIVLRQYYSVPAQVFLDPYIKQISIQEENTLNSEDITALHFFASHPKITDKQSIQLLNILSKAIYKNQIASPSAAIILEGLAQKFLKEDESFRSYLAKFIKLLITTYTDFFIAKAPKKSKTIQRSSTPKRLPGDNDDAIKSQCTLYIGFASVINKMLVQEGYMELKEFLYQCKDKLGKIECKPLDEIIKLYPRDPTPAESIVASSRQISEEHSVIAIQKCETQRSIRKNTSTILALFKPAEGKVKDGIEKARMLLEKRKQKELQIKEIATLKEQLTNKAIKRNLQKSYVPLSITNEIENFSPSKSNDHATSYTEITIIDLLEQEDRDERAITMFVKKYQKGFRFIFENYASTCFTEKPINFEELKSRSTTMIFSELYKFLKENGAEIVTKEDMQSIIKAMRQKSKENVNEKFIAYSEFKDFFIQVSVFMGDKAGLSYLPMVYNLESFMDKIIRSFSSRNQSTIVFTNPEVSSFGDVIVQKELNKKLSIDPNLELPSGYSKIKFEKMIFQSHIPPEIVINEPNVICCSLMDELLYSALEIHFIEQFSKVVSEVRATPKVTKNEHSSAKAKFMEGIDRKKKVKEKADESVLKEKEPSVAKLKRIPLSATLRILLSSAPDDQKLEYEVSANILEGMLMSLENGIDDVDKARRFLDPKVKNVYIQEKLEEEALHNKEKLEKEKKRLERYNEIKKKVEEKKQKQGEEEKEKKAKDKEDRIKKKEDAKKKIEDIQKMLEDKKKAKEEKLRLQKEEEAKKKEQEDESNKEQRDLKQKNHQQFLNKQITEQKTKWKQQQEERKKEEITQEKINKKKEEETKLYTHNKKKEETKLKSIAESQKMHTQIMSSQELTDLFNQYSSPLQAIYNFFTKLEDFHIDTELATAQPCIRFKTFTRFCWGFALIPYIISTEEAVFVFKSITSKQTKVDSNQKVDFSLGYEEFKESLVKIAEYGMNALNSEKLKPKSSKKAVYFINLSEMTIEYVVKLFNFLKVQPTDDKNTLQERLEKIRNANTKLRESLAKIEKKAEASTEVKDVEQKEEEKADENQEEEPQEDPE